MTSRGASFRGARERVCGAAKTEPAGRMVTAGGMRKEEAGAKPAVENADAIGRPMPRIIALHIGRGRRPQFCFLESLNFVLKILVLENIGIAGKILGVATSLSFLWWKGYR